MWCVKTGMSLTLLKQEVQFADDDEPVKLLIGLSAANADSHIGAIRALSELLCEEENPQHYLLLNQKNSWRILSPAHNHFLLDRILSWNTSLLVQGPGFWGFLTAMVIPNIGAFIARGFITALFIPTGWMPNEHFAKIVGPMITYLLPVMIGSTGGHLVGGKRGAVMGNRYDRRDYWRGYPNVPRLNDHGASGWSGD